MMTVRARVSAGPVEMSSDRPPKLDLMLVHDSLAKVYEVTSRDAHRLIEDFYTTTKGSRKPGFGPMAGVSAGVGMAASRAGAAGGVGVATEFSPTVGTDVQHGAKQIAKNLATLFVRQGGITQEKADKLFWDS
jgi:hypothetical protein